MTATIGGRSSTSLSQTFRSQTRADIQGLRALAVLAVIANHLLRWPSGGFIGVDIFFVISGFLITDMLVREYERTATISFRRFYERRVKRIVPAATVVLFLTTAASFVLLDASRFRATAWDALSSFFFVSNWRFAERRADYFQQGLPSSPLQHFWSLSIEEQFYFVWPWVLLGLMLAGTRKLGWRRRHLRLVAGVSVSVLTVASFAWALYETHNNPDLAYFSLLSRVWELGSGALIAVCATRLRIPSIAVRTLLAYIGMAGALTSLFVVPAAPGFPAPWALLPVLSTALIIVAGIGGDQPFLWPLTNRMSSYVGDISYSLYLWHFPVIVLLAALVETETLRYYLLAGIMISGLAVASFHLVEQPCRNSQWVDHGRRGGLTRFARGWQYAGVAALIVAAAAVLTATQMPRYTDPPVRSPSLGQSVVPPNDTAETSSCVGASALDPGNACELNNGSTYYPSLAHMADDTHGAFDCWIDEAGPLRSCRTGSSDPNARRAAVVGDSHAAMWLPVLNAVAEKHRIAIDSFVGFGCQWRTGESATCTARPEIQRRLEEGDYDYVFTSAARQFSGDSTQTYQDAWRPVSATGAQVVVIADVPSVSASARACITRTNFDPARDACATAFEEGTEVSDSLTAAAREDAEVAVVDLTDFFCVEDVCPGVIGNVLVYRDESAHITGTYGQSLIPYMSHALDQVLAHQ